MAKQGLSLSVFTDGDYENLHCTSSSFRNSMYDGLEVNKSHLKNCNFNEDIFKNIEAICNCRFATCGFNDCIFEDVHFYRNQLKDSTLVNTPSDQSVFNSTLSQNAMFNNNLIHSIKWTDIIFKNVSFKSVEVEGTTFRSVEFENCRFKSIIITNPTISRRLMNELQRQDVILESIDTSIQRLLSST